MAVYEYPEAIRTGISSLTKANTKALPARIKTVANPALKYSVGSGMRASMIGNKPPFDITAVRSSYLVDSYIRQAIDKYVEVIIKEGWNLSGSSDSTKYIQKRLSFVGVASGEPWEIILESLIRDYIKYGNSFLVVVRSKTSTPIPGMAIKPVNGKSPIIAYFNLPAHEMTPDLDENGNILGWVQQIGTRSKRFSVDDVLHFTYCKEAGGIWGIPPVVSVIEDIRALRQIEENVIKLIYKHLNPLLHQETPDITGSGEGRQEDIDDAINNLKTSAPDGVIVTPPGHKLSVIGAESQAIRAEGYMKYFKQRVFTGLGVSEMAMGENVGASVGTADALTSQMHNRVKMYQLLLSYYITNYIFNELLAEGGYDPWNIEEDRVVLHWNEIEIERQIKEQTHYLNLWTMNAISHEEFDKRMGINGEDNWADYYVHRVQIPQLIASRTAEDPLDSSLATVKPGNKSSKNSKTTGHGIGNGKAPIGKISKTGNQAVNIITPSNKSTGPLAKAGAPTAQKMSLDSSSMLLEKSKEETDALIESKFNDLCSKVLELIPEIQAKKIVEASSLAEKLFGELPNANILPLCSMLLLDVKEPNGHLRANARLLSEKSTICNILEELL
jgi:hypothetical protein